MKVPYPTRDMYLGGNSWLMAPEISTAVPGPNSILDFGKSDLWAVGAVAYEILGADNPFYPSRDNSHRQLSSGTYKEVDLPPLPAGVPEAVKKLVKSLLFRSPSKRPTASVAAAVAQMAALSATSEVHAGKSDLPPESRSQERKAAAAATTTKGRVHKRNKGHVMNRPGRQVLVACGPWSATHLSTCTSAAWSSRDRKWLDWVLAQGLALLCQLTFADQSKPWDMESVMNFLFLSRLTYADFREAVRYF
ncbi:serine/threonine-protein kinase pink1, mitochondrial [Plakobranchus ocellatus]|uniref:non-specific serine/threonine protein kinase n=1 Tax=Plakobranchus ocellatus TaxID=259542 RepID=A0AAV4ABU5_9GAST|nr:serine/threonine-protein kinase pink1, mitochondrial [Plakobranchus ocellatus]